MSAMPGLADWLRTELRRRGWNQARLAQRSGLSESTVSRLVSGEMKGREHDTQVALAQAFGMTHTELVGAVTGLADHLPTYRSTEDAINGDPNLTTRQRRALVDLYQHLRGAR